MPTGTPDAVSMETHVQFVEQLSLAVDDQTSSLLFTKLPAEVRGLIYTEVWRTGGVRQHLRGVGVAFTPCLIDETTPDIRVARFKAEKDGGVGSKWHRRLTSEWTMHWRCKEVGLEARHLEARHLQPFLPMLLTCKRLYVPCRPPHHGEFCSAAVATWNASLPSSTRSRSA